MKFFYENIVEKVRIINLSKDLKKGEAVEKENIVLLENLNEEIKKLQALRKKETQISKVTEIQSELLRKIEEGNKILGENL